MKTILDKGFKYTPANSTDIRKRFNRIRPGWNKKPEQKVMKPIHVVKLKAHG